MDTYRTVAAPSCAEYKDKGSRFLSFVYPVRAEDEIKQHLISLQKEHFKAVHHCYAYRLGYDGNNFRANDDGEPSGSAGRPILGQIDSFALTDTAIFVVRYFGGILLGVPGLIKAYKTASAEALRQAEIIEKNIEKTMKIRCEYQHLSGIRNVLMRHQAHIIAQELQADCFLFVSLPQAQFSGCLKTLQDMRLCVIETD